MTPVPPPAGAAPRPGPPEDLQAALQELHERYRTLAAGKVADYIPELAKANPDHFGICVCTPGGQLLEVGDIAVPFTLQSVSKPFLFGMALDDCGREHVLEHTGVEPTGDSFNSLITLDERSKRPHNPMVNAGAIAMASLTRGSGPTERLNRMLEMFSACTGHPVTVDMAVFMSERLTGHRNRAIAHLMKNFGMIDGNIDEALELYFQQCAILVTCRDLAVMAATLANHGVNPLTGRQAFQPQHIKDILSVMYTCGMYDSSGEWLYRVGLPAKSGVGGGLMAVVPNQFGLAVFSPPLDERGHSVRGMEVCKALSERYRLHLFDALTGSSASRA